MKKGFFLYFVIIFVFTLFYTHPIYSQTVSVFEDPGDTEESVMEETTVPPFKDCFADPARFSPSKEGLSCKTTMRFHEKWHNFIGTKATVTAWYKLAPAVSTLYKNKQKLPRNVFTSGQALLIQIVSADGKKLMFEDSNVDLQPDVVNGSPLTNFSSIKRKQYTALFNKGLTALYDLMEDKDTYILE